MTIDHDCKAVITMKDLREALVALGIPIPEDARGFTAAPVSDKNPNLIVRWVEPHRCNLPHEEPAPSLANHIDATGDARA